MMFDAIKTATADKIVGAEITIKTDMVPYGGWGWREHLEWISDVSGLDLVELSSLVWRGYVVLTNETVSVVWLVSKDNWNSKARLIYEG